MNDHTPKIGESVVARRKVKLNAEHNFIVGKVIESTENYCRIETNPGTDCHGDFTLKFNEWKFKPLNFI